MLKKITTAVLAMIITLSLCCPSVFAKEETKEVHISEWVKALEDARDYYNGGNPEGIVYTYKKSGGKNKTNCAEYVSKAMQIMGWLPKGQNIWLSSKINGSGASYIKNNNDFEIYYPDKPTKKCIADGTLQPGDIVGYHPGPGVAGGVHTMVYIGNNQWYSYGSGTKNWNTGPISKRSYDNKNVKVIIRYKNLRVSDDHSLKVNVINGIATINGQENNSFDTLVNHGDSVSVKFKPYENCTLKNAEMDGSPVDISKGIDINEMRSAHNIRIEYEYKYSKYLPADLKNAEIKSGLIKGLDENTNRYAFEVDADKVYVGIWKDDKTITEIHEIKKENGKVDISKYLKKDGEYNIIVIGKTGDKTYVEGKTFTYDTTAPKTEINGMENGSTATDIVDLDIIAKDKNIDRCNIQINGENTDLRKIRIEGDGRYVVSVKAEDKAGNVSETETRFILMRPINSYDLSPEINIDKTEDGNPYSVTVKPSIPGDIEMHVYRNKKLICINKSMDNIKYDGFELPGKYEIYTYITDVFENQKVVKPIFVERK